MAIKLSISSRSDTCHPHSASTARHHGGVGVPDPLALVPVRSANPGGSPIARGRPRLGGRILRTRPEVLNRVRQRGVSPLGSDRRRAMLDSILKQ